MIGKPDNRAVRCREDGRYDQRCCQEPGWQPKRIDEQAGQD